MNGVGILNSNSHIKAYVNDLKREQVERRTRTTVDTHDLETLAANVAVKFDLAIFHGQDVKIREYERQLVLIANYANDLKCVQKGG